MNSDSSNSQTNFHKRIAHLESSHAHLDRQYDQLNEVVTELNKTVVRLQSTIKKLAETMESHESDRLHVANQKPPHH